jgi:DNA-binding response OmpR family regulator
VFLIQQALQQAGIDALLHIANDGAETMEYVERVDADPTLPCPDLILLDINMPRYKGGDILRKLRSSSRCADALVLVVTSSDALRDREEMTTLGADGYFRKPTELSEFMKLGGVVRELLSRNK